MYKLTKNLHESANFINLSDRHQRTTKRYTRRRLITTKVYRRIIDPGKKGFIEELRHAPVKIRSVYNRVPELGGYVIDYQDIYIIEEKDKEYAELYPTR
jgi:hypothetical protein